MEIPDDYRPADYSLTGRDSVLAVEKGLTDAAWYAPHISNEALRSLLERRDGPALRDTLLWFALLFIFGLGIHLLWGSGWVLLPFAAYAVLYASSSDSRWHESGHGTAFKTDWMNNALYEIASFMVLRESLPWRWSHTRHHSDTIIVGRDPEIAVQRPPKLLPIFLNIFNLMALRKYVTHVARHLFGRLTPDERTFIPDSERSRITLRAWIYLFIYAGVIGAALATRSLLPLMYIGLPSFFGVWLGLIYGYTQHTALAENVLDHRLNSRTVLMNRINRYLYWNMGYHIEHHVFPLVPYHALPRLHALVKSEMPPPLNGLVAAYREIIPAVRRQRQDPTYYLKRQLPAPPASRAETAQASRDITGEGRPMVDGWVEVCASDLLKGEDVLRFDFAHRTYAIYRTAEGKFYATDGVCTHGNTHLAGGFVSGMLVECPKHNGRFDIRDGSPQRLPVCVALKTYQVQERQGRLLLDITSAGGLGLAEQQSAYSFRVVSNRNVATFVKELVLEPDAGSPTLTYQPGEYLQFDIPAYPDHLLRDLEIHPLYADIWETQRIFDLVAANPLPCRRNYSFASNPAAEQLLRFNVRLATPPGGTDFNAGVGSSYIFSLKPSDRITAIGPFGDFHIKDTAREMVYLGGGAGMAPLRAHISYLLETQNSSRRISYWYGARSRQELFYQDYFEELARQHANFSFHIALSEPQAADAWTGHTGFIHAILQSEYLATHPDPRAIDYYLCGPRPMVHAAVQMLSELGVDSEQVAYDEF